jgi:hypothetical protein
MTSSLEMTRTLGITVTAATVKALDNGGDDCQYCSEYGAQVTSQIYYVIDGEKVMEDGCGACMLGRIFEVNALGVDAFHIESKETK